MLGQQPRLTILPRHGWCHGPHARPFLVQEAWPDLFGRWLQAPPSTPTQPPHAPPPADADAPHRNQPTSSAASDADNLNAAFARRYHAVFERALGGQDGAQLRALAAAALAQAQVGAPSEGVLSPAKRPGVQASAAQVLAAGPEHVGFVPPLPWPWCAPGRALRYKL